MSAAVIDWQSSNTTTLKKEKKKKHLHKADSKLANTVAAGLAQRVVMLPGSRFCASARFSSFPDVGAPPCWPATASHSLHSASNHSCYQYENSEKKVLGDTEERKTQSEVCT